MVHSIKGSGEIYGDGNRSLGGLGFNKAVGDRRNHGEKSGSGGAARAKTMLRLV